MTITLDKSGIELVKKDANAHCSHEVDDKSRERRSLFGPVRGPEAVTEWQGYAFLCELLIYTRSTVGLCWPHQPMSDGVE
jgi:hypothetical protein